LFLHLERFRHSKPPDTSGRIPGRRFFDRKQRPRHRHRSRNHRRSGRTLHQARPRDHTSQRWRL